ncbi:MerR family transcriptional regulator [Gloeobacter morelensis]|uniref:MerR family transcriptional regulator n=1 Tax=Gloeobacter morelensis TaxID=2907343 RepID=UPI001E4C589C|nr:MerR family transcriptional regulator [Gloeobacter morelensis]UFP97167.1 MerR family transcriptional regulator [Gloeobacter morelensis MG652769]
MKRPDESTAHSEDRRHALDAEPRRGEGGPGCNQHQPVYTISVASTLTGLHPQTIRKYERRGLLLPQRSRGNMGYRLYSRSDVDLLLNFKRLTTEGLNVESAAIVVALQNRLRDADRRLVAFGRLVP